MGTNDKQDDLEVSNVSVDDSPSSEDAAAAIEETVALAGEPVAEAVDALDMVTITMEQDAASSQSSEDEADAGAEDVAEAEEVAEPTPSTEPVVEDAPETVEDMPEGDSEPEAEQYDATVVMADPEPAGETEVLRESAPEPSPQPPAPEANATSASETAPSKLDALKSKFKPWMLAPVAVVIVGIALAVHFSNLSKRYDEASAEFDRGNYETAAQIYQDLGNYKDSAELYESATLWALADAAEDAAGTDPAKWIKAAEAYEAIKLNLVASASAERCRDTATYYEAMKLLDGDGINNASNLQQAIELLESCNGVLDSDVQINRCENGLTYLDAKKLMADGKWNEAAEAFDSIVESDYTDAASLRRECLDHAAYDEAEALYSSKHYYDAYKRFLELEWQMEDASYDWLPDLGKRADACKYSTPENSVVYRNDAYGDGCELTIDNAGFMNAFYKLYFGEELITSVFVREDSSFTFMLPSGTYRMKKAYGNEWWGPDDMFGDEGSYYVCSFGGADQVTLEYNNGYMISAGGEGTGIGTSYADRGSF